jgi:hypothetical protein
MKLSGAEFVRRFLLNVLPAGFVRIRHYGIFSTRHRQEMLALCRQLLETAAPVEAAAAETVKHAEAAAAVTPTHVCPQCGVGRMIVIPELPRLVLGVATLSAACAGVDSS